MAKENTDKIAEWFEGRTLPEGPFTVKPGIIIHNPGLYVERNLRVLRSCDHGKYGAGRREYFAAYMHLYDLKKYIEDKDAKKDK